MSNVTLFAAYAVRTGVKLAMGLILAAGLTLMSGFANAATCPESKVAESAGKALIKAAQAGSAPEFSRALQTYANMNTIAVFALGKHRKLLPESRKAEFVAATTSYISRAFNDYRLKFRADTIRFLDCRGQTVKTELTFLGGRPPQPVLWRMAGRKVTDVNVQGVWLGQMLRKNYDRVLSKSPNGIEALFTHIKSK